MIFDLDWFSGFVRGAKEKRFLFASEKVYCDRWENVRWTLQSKAKRSQFLRKTCGQQKDTGAFRRALPLDLGWEEISHKKGRGKREIQVQICYFPSLKGHFLRIQILSKQEIPISSGQFLYCSVELPCSVVFLHS